MGISEDAARLMEVSELRAALRRSQRQAAKAQATRADLVEAVYQAARDVALAVGKIEPVKVPALKRKGSPLHAILHLSDWQIGKRTATFNPDVAVDRVREAVRRAVKIVGMERAAHPVPVVHLLLGGDFVEGVSIFPGQAWEVTHGVIDQAFIAAGLIQETVVTLLAEFSEVHVWWVPGNHGRIGRRGDHPPGDNIDTLACRIAKERTEHLKRLTWHGPTEEDDWFVIVEAGAYRALMVHGDDVPRTAPAILRKCHEWKSGVLPPFQDVFFGHVHSEHIFGLKNGDVAFITPSIETSNKFAKRVVAGQSRPAQRLHFVDPERGRRASERMLWLD